MAGAMICRAMLRDLAQVRAANADRLLTLTEAAVISGYSPDHLGRLARQGKIPNAGTKYRPRLRAGDLPRRPQQQSIAKPAATAYDPVADARSLAGRRKGAA